MLATPNTEWYNEMICTIGARSHPLNAFHASSSIYMWCPIKYVIDIRKTGFIRHVRMLLNHLTMGHGIIVRGQHHPRPHPKISLSCVSIQIHEVKSEIIKIQTRVCWIWWSCMKGRYILKTMCISSKSVVLKQKADQSLQYIALTVVEV